MLRVVQNLPFSPLDFDASNPYLHLPDFSLKPSNLEQKLKSVTMMEIKYCS